ncbi:hypothetical protein BDA96_06G123400 [Sorghum bicolor]|uniref:Uncharacterized protein n=2 Tax=Sorghum bicolor TaxID=4558 RepID=A0A921UD52_SORBI|nr:hypothetical protein BDA96_06G123400 [Sorghum bicolor]OQU81738.1 hypothetical protein SORBI_3006G111450 [Sorghum bicolor]
MYPPCFFQAHFVFFNCLLVFLLLFSLMLIDLLDMWMGVILSYFISKR